MDLLVNRWLGRFLPRRRGCSLGRPGRYRPTFIQLESRELLSAGLVAAYSFDQASGTTLVDDSGNGNNGTIANATRVGAGRFGSAVQFDGSAGSLVTVPEAASLHLTTGMSLEAWVKPSGVNSAGTRGGVVLSASPDGSSVLYAAAGTGRTPAGQVRVAAGDGWVRGRTPLRANVWTFLAATYDGGTLRLYVNGRQVGASRAGGPLNATGPFHLGGNATAGMFAGLLDNVRIYDRALTAAEIRGDMTTPVSATATPATGASTAPPAPTAGAGSSSSGTQGGPVTAPAPTPTPVPVTTPPAPPAPPTPPSGPIPPPDTDSYLITAHDRIPNFGAHPTITSVRSGTWTDPATWSLGRLPGAGDVVDINPGTAVTYDALASAPLNTLEIQPSASLTFRTDINTRVVVGNFLVLPGGYLQVGTQADPVAASVLADVVLANQPINTTTDPEQFGTGLIVLGQMTTYGAPRTSFVTLAQEAHAGDNVLHLASPVAGWQPGDDVALPDTRQLGDGSGGTSYQPQWEELTVQTVSADGKTVTLTASLRYDHLGARDAAGVLDYLPQAVNRERSIMIGSQDEGSDPGQTRGYVLLTDRANVDIRNTGFCELGRTTATAENDTTFDSSGHVTHLGTNEGDRAPMTAQHLLGPTSPQPDGYQFTFAGNVVDDDGAAAEAKQTHLWGIVLNDSHYGLVQDNVVYNVAGAGIGVEDGASSFNVFDHNFVLRVVGTAHRPDRQLQGDAFWFGNPNNHITSNVAADVNGSGTDVYSYGFDVDASGVGTVTVPASQGADPSQAGQGRPMDMNDTPLLEFAGNTVYGATKSGMTLWWIGTFGDDFYPDAQVSVVKNFTAWHFSSRAIYGYPVNNVTIDGLVVRGDVSSLANYYVYTTGINFDDYMTRNLVIQNVDIQGMATGINAPFMVGRVPAMDTTLIQNSFLDNRVNISLSPARSVNGNKGLSPMTLDITNVRFSHPAQGHADWQFNVSLDPITVDALGTSDFSVPQLVYVYDYNGVAGDNFQVFYTGHSPTTTTRPDINGYVQAL
jgi:hypothetical protein